MRNFRSKRYWEKVYPMNTWQKEAHNRAMDRTVKYFRERRMMLTKKDIPKVLTTVSLYITNVAYRLHKRSGKEDPSVVKVHFGYFRVIFTKLFHDMHQNGEFTDEEFYVIRNEFYKKEFDIYYDIIKQREKWAKNKKQQRLQ